MRAGLVVGAVLLLALSVACIVSTVVEMARGAFGMGSWRFLGALVFHPLTGLAGLLLLHLACRRGKDAAASPAVGSATGEEGRP